MDKSLTFIDKESIRCECDKIRTRRFYRENTNCTDRGRLLRILPEIPQKQKRPQLRNLFPKVIVRNKKEDSETAIKSLGRSVENIRLEEVRKPDVGDLIEPATPFENSIPRARQKTEFWTITPREH